VRTGLPVSDRTSAGVFYDGECRFCTHTARRFERILERRRLALVPLQTPGAGARLGVSDDRLLDEMRLRLEDGTVLGGGAAVVEIARRIWWAWPLWAISRLPGAMPPMRAAYRWVARRRGCANGACEVPRQAGLRLRDCFPIIILPALAFAAAPWVPRWGFMWTMAVAIYAGCKWLTYREARDRVVRSNRFLALGYLLAWPGMDAAAFLGARPDGVAEPCRLEWIVAALKTIFGVGLIWFVTRLAVPVHPLAAGWIAMAGLICSLHFGVFHLLSLGWRRAGVNAVPVMRNPLRSRSLAEFWGRRWNTAFHELATRFTFRPLRTAVGAAGAALLVFLVSGLIHELVISVPAGGGYGLPTGYFAVQGLGVAGERSQFGQRLGLAEGWRGWLFTVVVAAGPAYWLFPPPFVRNVILPMLAAIGAV
jgi:predicted DCC family thiol-disulfide oxidoreductase YuxK